MDWGLLVDLEWWQVIYAVLVLGVILWIVMEVVGSDRLSRWLGHKK